MLLNTLAPKDYGFVWFNRQTHDKSNSRPWTLIQPLWQPYYTIQWYSQSHYIHSYPKNHWKQNHHTQPFAPSIHPKVSGCSILDYFIYIFGDLLLSIYIFFPWYCDTVLYYMPLSTIPKKTYSHIQLFPSSIHVYKYTCISRLCMYIYIYMFICKYSYTYINMHIYMYRNIYMYKYIYIYICIDTFTYIRIYVYIYIFKYIYMYRYTYIYIYVYIQVFMYPPKKNTPQWFRTFQLVGN